MDRIIMIACHNIKKELLKEAHVEKSSFPIYFIPRDLHLSPEKMRKYLQELINAFENVEYILLPMGRCGNGTMGLVSNNASIVLPKCNDCIDLLLSKKDLNLQRSHYTYFLTEGWLGSKNSIDYEYQYTLNKYGEKKGKMIIDMIYNHYQYFTLIDTGVYDLKTTQKKISPLANMADMTINYQEGSCAVLNKMMRLDFDKNFAIVPPSEAVSEKYFI